MDPHFPWLWDTDMDNATFEAILRGDDSRPPHDSHWAMARLIEYAPYDEIRRLLPREKFLADWPAVTHRVRSRTRREGMDFVYHWLLGRTQHG
jgi:hypothetical protein